MDEQVIVGLRPAGEMVVILPATDDGQTAAQEPVALARQWTRNGVDARIKDFSLLQDPDTLLTQVALIVNACPPGRDEPADMLVVAQNLSPCDRSAWLTLATSSTVAWVFDGAPLDAGMIAADLVAFLPQDRMRPSPLTLAVTGRSPTKGRLATFASGADGVWQIHENDLPGPTQTAVDAPCVALSSGLLGGRGSVFALTDDNVLRFATFTPDGLAYASAGALNVPADVRLSAIGSAHDPSAPEACRLYAVGNGLYRWDSESVATASAPARLLGPLPDLAFDQVAVSIEGASEAVAIFARTRQADLYFCRDWIAGDTPSEAPLVIANEVASATAVRTIIDAQDNSASRYSAAVSFTDGALQLLERDLGDSASPWAQRAVLVPIDSGSACIEQSGYSVRVQLKDDKQVPAGCDAVTITAHSSCGAMLNGSYMRLPRGVPIRTFVAPDGVLSLSVPSLHLDCPQFTIDARTEGGAQALSLYVDPAGATQQKLRALQTASDIVDAKDCHGRPVFAAPPADAGEVATFLRGFFAMHDEAHGKRDATSVKAPRSIALHRSSGGLKALTLHDAEAVGDIDLGTVVDVATLMMTLWSSRRSIQAFVGIRAVGDLTYLTVQVGKDLAYSALWTFAGRATSIALTWLVERFLDLDPEKVVGWLGWVFDWDGIDRMEQGVGKLLRSSADYIENNADVAIAYLDKAVTAIESGSRFVANLSDAHLANPLFKQKLADFGACAGSGASSAIPTAWTAHNDAPGFHHINRKFMDGVTSRSFDATQIADTDLSTLVPGAQALAVPLESLAAELQPVLDDQDILQMSLADLMKAIGKAAVDKLTDALKEAYRLLLQSLKTIISASRNSLNIPVNVPVLNYLWTEKLQRKEPMVAADFFSLSAACAMSFAGRAAGVTIMNEQQLRVILDPANKTLPQILAGLTPRQVARKASRGRGAAGPKPIAAFSVYWLSGIFQCASAAVGMVGAAITVWQFQLGAGASTSGFGRWLQGEPAGMDDGYSWTNANILRAASNIGAMILCTGFFIVSFTSGAYPGTVWFILFALWYWSGAIYFTIGDAYAIHRNRGNPAVPALDRLYDGGKVSKNIQTAVGIFCLVLVIPATILMGFEPNVAVEFRGGIWQIDTLLSGLINVDVGILLLAGRFTRDPDPRGRVARYVVGGSVLFINTAFFTKGILEWYMSNTVAYTDLTVLSKVSPDANIAGVINSFAADGSGPQPSEQADVTYSSPSYKVQPGFGLVLAQGQSLASSSNAGFNVVVVPMAGRIAGFFRGGATGEYVQLNLRAARLGPARAALGPRGLYVVNVVTGSVWLFDLPLRFDDPDALHQEVASQIRNPGGICVSTVGQGFDIAERIFVTELSAVAMFDGNSKRIGSLTGPNTFLSKPFSLATDSSKTWLIVADKDAGLLKFKLSDTGDVAPTAQWTFAPDYVTDVAVDEKGNIVYTSATAIHFMPLETPAGANPPPSRTITFESGQPDIIALAVGT